MSRNRDYDAGRDLLTCAKRGDLTAFVNIVKNEGFNEDERRDLLNAAYGESEETVLHIAAKDGRKNIVSWLLSNEPGKGRQLGFNSLMAENYLGGTALVSSLNRDASNVTFFAIINGCINDEEKRELLNAVDLEGETLLYHVSHEPTLFSWLLSNEPAKGRQLGFDSVTARNYCGETVLHYILKSTTSEPYHALMDGCTEEEKEELLNAVDDDGQTVVHCATYAAFVDALNEFLVHPTTQKWINARDQYGMAPLHYTTFRSSIANDPPRNAQAQALLSHKDIDPNIEVE